MDGPVGEGGSVGQVELGAVHGIGLDDVAVSGAVRALVVPSHARAGLAGVRGCGEIAPIKNDASSKAPFGFDLDFD